MILDKIMNIIAPHSCLGCGYEGTLLCALCLTGVKEPALQCYLCNTLGALNGICRECAQTSHISSVQAAVTYEGLAKELVHKIKYERAQAAATAMAAVMVPLLPERGIVCPVPTANVRVRQRGYDQAVLLARQLSAQSGFTTASLLKRQQTTQQVGAGRTRRSEQMASAFRITDASLIAGQAIVLVDDVITTGATIGSAAQLLHDAGAIDIHVRAFAHTPAA